MSDPHFSSGMPKYYVTDTTKQKSKEELRQEIEEQTKKFLKKGGKIKVQEIETGRNPELFPKSKANNKTSVY